MRFLYRDAANCRHAVEGRTLASNSLETLTHAAPNKSLQQMRQKRRAAEGNVRSQKEAAPVVRSQGHSLP